MKAKASNKERFSINKLKTADWLNICIIDNKKGKILCHLNVENGEKYCDKWASIIVKNLNK